MQQGTYSLSYRNRPAESSSVAFRKQARRLVMTQTRVDSEDQLRGLALKLCKSMITFNEIRSVVDPADIEEMIVSDFVNLEEVLVDPEAK